MEQKQLGFAIVGTGVIAPYHCQALQSIDRARVVLVCDSKLEKAQKFAAERQIQATDRLENVLDHPEIDVVHVTVPSGLHADIGIQAARAGKHVIVEKPIDVTLEKADNLIEACDKAGVTLSVISQNRFLDPVLKMTELVQGGKLGTLLQGDAYIKWYRSQEYYDSGDWRGTRALDGGGAFMNQGIHFIDLLLSVMGPVRWLYAKSRTAAHRIEVEDIGAVLIEFTSGALGVIQASTCFYPGLPAQLDIHGTEGTIRIEGERLALGHLQGADPFSDGKKSIGGAADPAAIDATPFIRQFTDVIDAIQNKREPIVSGRVARRPLELILKIYESAATGKPIKVNQT